MAPTSTLTTRLNTEVYLIGPMALYLLSTTLKQLTTIKQVLQTVFFYQLIEIWTVRNASHMSWKKEYMYGLLKLTFLKCQ